MGVYTRDYMQRPVPTTAHDDELGEIPLWEQMADALRVRLYKIIQHAPINSIQDAHALTDALAQLQAVHGRGQIYDKADPQDDD